ncbi:hypothetical protein [Caulobacter sp. 17J80-11]|uniref:CC0125/CC1285 family lipoprotein n=1 Tax=Caulobacter sp. 17J80-11 TaxID=2763502 RepID=UPI00165375CE|nr:hypothetical protein [Caulobacter sp. 17J80-11]MBC6983373.1 hypothetical protein [Caulobacter sp. 17J80-11]
MKRILTVALAALALSACATATPYQPAAAGPGGRGYSDMRIEDGRWAVSFSGNSVTSRETVEMYLLYRAAELTVQNGYDYFTVVNRAVDRDTRYISSPDPWYGGWGPYWSPYWRWNYGGAWSPWGWGWPSYDVREVNRYEASAEILMHRGQKPADDHYAFDAREVMTNLGPRVLLPSPK